MTPKSTPLLFFPLACAVFLQAGSGAGGWAWGGGARAGQPRGWWGSAACMRSSELGAWRRRRKDSRPQALPGDDGSPRVEAAGVSSPAGPRNPHRPHTKSRSGVLRKRGPHLSPAGQGQDARESFYETGAQQGPGLGLGQQHNKPPRYRARLHCRSLD